MLELMELGPTPIEESCVQVEKDGDYIQAMRKEVSRYVVGLRRIFPLPGIFFRMKRNEHDLGTYYEAAVHYNDDDRTAVENALFVESNLPNTWEDMDMTTPYEPKPEAAPVEAEA